MLLRTALGVGWDHGTDTDRALGGNHRERENEAPSSAPLRWRFCPGAPRFMAVGVEVVQGQEKSEGMPW